MVRSDNAASPSDNRHPHYSHPPLDLFDMAPNDADGIHGSASPATYDGSAAASCVSSPGAASASSLSNEPGRARYNGRRECCTHCFSCVYPRFAAAVGCQVPDGVHCGTHCGTHHGTHHGAPHGMQLMTGHLPWPVFPRNSLTDTPQNSSRESPPPRTKPPPRCLLPQAMPALSNLAGALSRSFM